MSNFKSPWDNFSFSSNDNTSKPITQRVNNNGWVGNHQGNNQQSRQNNRQQGALRVQTKSQKSAREQERWGNGQPSVVKKTSKNKSVTTQPIAVYQNEQGFFYYEPPMYLDENGNLTENPTPWQRVKRAGVNSLQKGVVEGIRASGVHFADEMGTVLLNWIIK